MKLLSAAVTFVCLSSIACAQAFAGTGIIYHHSDLATSKRTHATLDDAIVDDLFGANFLTNAATHDPKDDSQRDARIAGTFVGNPN
jgi:hypothetical protein